MFWHVPEPSLESVHFPAQTFRTGRISLHLFREERNSAQEVEMIHLSHTAGCTWLSDSSWWICFQFFCFSNSTSSYGILTVTQHCTSSKDSSTEVQPSNSILALKILLKYMLCFLLHWMVMTSFTDPIYAAFTNSVQSLPTNYHFIQIGTFFKKLGWNLSNIKLAIVSQWEFAVWLREPKMGALWKPRGMGGGYKREGACVYPWPIHVMYGKNCHNTVIILQLKIRLKKISCCKVNKSMAFSTFHDVQPPPLSSSRIFSSLPKETPCLLSTLPPHLRRRQ